MQKIISFVAVLLFITLLFLNHGNAQSLKIISIVNDDVITAYDLENRMRFIIFSTQAQPDQAAFERIQSQALRTLIDEKLKIQAAKEKNITIPPALIDKEVEGLEQRNNLSVGQLPLLLSENNIDMQTLRDRIEADLSWHKFVSRELGRKIRISEDQVDDELAGMASQQSQTQKRIFEIFLPFDGAALESDTRAVAQELKRELQEGATFTTLARNYSKSRSAQLGGDRGWLGPGQLEEEIDAEVQELKVGEISEPIETLTGIYLFQVAELRNLTGDIGETEISLVHLSEKITDAFTEDILLGKFNRLKPQINSCEAALTAAENDDNIRSTQSDKILLKDLSGTVKEQVQNLEVNQSTAAIPLTDAVILLTLCARKQPQSNLPSRREIRNHLFSTKLDLSARQRLRDLRNAAFIDIRN